MRFSRIPMIAGSVVITVMLPLASAVGEGMTFVKPSTRLESCGPDAPAGCRHLVVRGDPRTGPSQRVYRFPAGFVFAKHLHTANESIVVTKGTLSIAAEGQSERTLGIGEYLYIPAMVVHWGGCPEECELFLIEDGPSSFVLAED